jgi:hypothetical protein
MRSTEAMRQQYELKMGIFLDGTPFKEQVSTYADRFIAPIEALRAKQEQAKAIAISHARAPGQISQFLMFCNRLFYGAVNKGYESDTLNMFGQSLFDGCIIMYKWITADQECAQQIASECFSCEVDLPA